MLISLNNKQVKDFLAYFPQHKQTDIVQELLMLAIHLVLERLSSLTPPETVQDAIEQISRESRKKCKPQPELLEDPDNIDCELKNIRSDIQEVSRRIEDFSRTQPQAVAADHTFFQPHLQQTGRQHKRKLTPKVTEVQPEGCYRTNPPKLRNYHLDDHQIKEILQYDFEPAQNTKKKSTLGTVSAHNVRIKGELPKSSLVDYNKRSEQKTLSKSGTPKHLKKAESKIKLLVQKDKEELRRRQTNTQSNEGQRYCPRQPCKTNPELGSSSVIKAAGVLNDNLKRSNLELNEPRRLNQERQILCEDASSVSDFSEFDIKECRPQPRRPSPTNEQPSSGCFDSIESSAVVRRSKIIGTISRKRKNTCGAEEATPALQS